MGAFVTRTRYDEGTESAEVATSALGQSLPRVVCPYTMKNAKNLERKSSADRYNVFPSPIDIQ